MQGLLLCARGSERMSSMTSCSRLYETEIDVNGSPVLIASANVKHRFRKAPGYSHVLQEKECLKNLGH